MRVMTVQAQEIQKNQEQQSDDFEIDIVAETLDGEVEAYEVKRNPLRYNPHRLAEKVAEMQHHLFKGKNVRQIGLSLNDM